MVKIIAVVGFLSFVLAFNANAQDSDRIVQLEKEIQEIKVRLSRLESLLSTPSKAQDLETSREGWKSVGNWRKLTRGMDPSDVRQLLGEPDRVLGGAFTFWEYQNGGTVAFYEEKVDRWTEPRK
ncbi:MAG TPA: hypothetical protein VJS12_25090 [Steroidobacteraceae bacterium]|nr:hypothetical protein [Steroidobacteraceae bacterium]